MGSAFDVSRTLHDELLQNFHDAGVYDFAEELGIIGVGDSHLGGGHDMSAAVMPMLGLSPLRLHAGAASSDVAAAARAAVLQHSRKRAADEQGAEEEHAAREEERQGPTPAKKASSARGAQRATPPAEKAGKGLRHFSMKVCEKVESKGRTTYNEVADELVAEFSHPDYASEQQFDEKNIRRRVYDALNVLMAMNIISKERKDITWRGLPTSPDADLEALRAEKLRVRLRCDKKHAHLAELVEQHGALEALLARNAAARALGEGGAPASRIALPFILVQTRPGTTVEVEMSEDQQLMHFDFNSTQFKIHDDAFVLGGLGLVPPVLSSSNGHA